ncbi:MAG: hypothetical protein NUV91_00495 [Candidatus Omnitrophica bacterium]|nr:hypothetical protein [Candidatus Omnitrophota bacterium]
MGEKTLLTLIVLFLVVGVFAYDRYVTEQGELGPVARLMDYAGLGEKFQNIDNPFFQKKVTQTSSQYRIGEVYDIYQKIEGQRLELMQHRQEIIHQLQGMNGELNQEASQYATSLNQEQEAFLERFPELRKFLSQLHQNQEGKDWKAEASNFLNTQMILSEEKKIEVAHMLDHFDQQNVNVQELFKTARSLEKEYQVLETNTAATQRQLTENHDEIEMRFQQLTRKMVQVTDEDMSQLMDSYQNLWKAEEILLANLEINQQRVRQQQEAFNKQWSKVIDQVKLSSQAVKESGKNVLIEKSHELCRQLRMNEQQIHQNLDDRFWGQPTIAMAASLPLSKEDLSMVSSSSAGISISSTRMMDVPDPSRRFSMPKRPIGDPKISSAGRQATQNFSANHERRFKDPSRRPSVRSRVPSSSRDDGMQRLREQARDQGFYDL